MSVQGKDRPCLLLDRNAEMQKSKLVLMVRLGGRTKPDEEHPFLGRKTAQKPEASLARLEGHCIIDIRQS